jgi:hypothetical protein
MGPEKNGPFRLGLNILNKLKIMPKHVETSPF